MGSQFFKTSSFNRKKVTTLGPVMTVVSKYTCCWCRKWPSRREFKFSSVHKDHMLSKFKEERKQEERRRERRGGEGKTGQDRRKQEKAIAFVLSQL
jgi:hypothetical protein